MTQLLDNLVMALGTLRANPLRSALTLLGIVIGAMTVVAMMSLTEGLRQKVKDDVALLGSDSFAVSKWPAPGFGDQDWQKFRNRKPITRDMGEALRGLPHVAGVSIEESYERPFAVSTSEKATKPIINVVGAVPDIERSRSVSLAAGRFFSNSDVQLSRRVAVLGADVADALFPDAASAIGQEVRVKGAPFEVIGVAERMGSILGLESKDGYLLVPWTAFELALGRVENNDLVVIASATEDVPKAIDEVVTTLRRLRGLAPLAENDFDSFTNDSVNQMFDNLALMINAASLGVCALALLVGGIGIMNIMLVSVTERTREIGVRMALGARRRRILTQFVFEAVTLSLLGGLIGVLLGASVAVGARELLRVPASIPAWAVILSLASACGAGLLFGIYPAARASRLDPVEAMRTE
jgi:putative ABC transport system permease protein